MNEAGVVTPLGRSHHLQPRRPLMALTRRDRDIAVAGRQDADGGAVAVGEALARPASSMQAGTRQFGHCQRGQCFVDRNVDHRAGRRSQSGMHTGTRRGDPADERGLFAHRTDRRFVEVVHLSGQQAGNTAGKAQCEVGCGVVGLWPGLAERRDEHQSGGGIVNANIVRVMASRAQFRWAALDDNQVGGGERIACCGGGRLAVVEIGGKRRRVVWIDARDIRAGIGKQAPADSGGQAAPQLHHAKACQQSHAMFPPSHRSMITSRSRLRAVGKNAGRPGGANPLTLPRTDRSDHTQVE